MLLRIIIIYLNGLFLLIIEVIAVHIEWVHGRIVRRSAYRVKCYFCWLSLLYWACVERTKILFIFAITLCIAWLEIIQQIVLVILLTHRLVVLVLLTDLSPLANIVFRPFSTFPKLKAPSGGDGLTLAYRYTAVQIVSHYLWCNLVLINYNNYYRYQGPLNHI